MFKFTLNCYTADLIDVLDANLRPALTLGGDDMDALRTIGVAFLGKAVFTDSEVEACYTITNNLTGERVDDWGQGRPAPKMCEEVKARLEERAGVRFF